MKKAILLLLALVSFVMADNYQYTLRWLQGNAHTYEITVTTDAAKAKHTDFWLPVWRPGRYFEQDFAAAVTRFAAKDEAGKPLKWQKTAKSTWRVENPKKGRITLTYQFFANTKDAGSCYVDDHMAYFNGHNLFMFKDGGYDLPCTLHVPQLNDDWQVASGLKLDREKNTLSADSYHDFIDCPTILSSRLQQFRFDYKGHTYWLHFQVDKQMDEAYVAEFKENVRKIVAEQEAIFGEVPFEGDYHFIYWLVPFRIHHAVEHHNSAMFCKPETVAESPKSLNELNGITSHEFWHVWNVKSIRPAALWPYDYRAPQYTTLHWFTEGVTEYYTNLTLVRAGLISRESFVGITADNWAELDNSLAYAEISPSQSSWDSWLVRSMYMPPHLRNSYYPLGHRVGILLDLRIRTLTGHKKSLDDVFRYLYTTYTKKGQGVPEDGVQTASEAVTGQSFQEFFDTYVHGTQPLDYKPVLKPLDLKLTEGRKEDSRKGSEKIGLSGLQTIQEGYQYIAQVDRESPAYKAGITDGQLILLIDGKNPLQYEWDKLEVGQNVELMISDVTGERVIKVKYEKTYQPLTYELELPKNADWIDIWLKSQVK